MLDSLIFSLLLVVPLWKIHAKAGLRPALSLLVFVPLFGLIVVSAVLAFVHWPVASHESRARRS